MDQLGITVFDVAVIAVAVFGAAIGLSAGFAHAILFIASWIGAGWAALRFPRHQPEIQQLVGSDDSPSSCPCWWSRGRPDRAGHADQCALRAMRASPWGSRSHPGGGLRRPVRVGRHGHGLSFLHLPGPKALPPPVEAGRLPADQGNGHFVEPYLPPGFGPACSSGRASTGGRSSYPDPLSSGYQTAAVRYP